MYGVVFTEPIVSMSSLVSEDKVVYNAPWSSYEKLGQNSGYLKVLSVGCNGCQVLFFNKKLSNNLEP